MNVPAKEIFSSLPVREQIEHVTHVDAKTRQTLILSSRNSLALTRALPSELLLFTLKENGLADSVELLALAAPEQLRDMIDLDCWCKDRLDARRILSWLMLLDEAGSGKLAEWLLHTDGELLVLLVKRYLEVVRKADVEDEAGFDEARYFTFDDQYLLRFLGEEEPILQLLLERQRVLDYDVYKKVLEESLFELESGLEEEALRWRNTRLAERGYPNYDEAQEIYRFVPPEAFSLDQYRRANLSPLRYASREEVTPPNHALALLDVSDSLFLRTLATLPPEGLEQVGQELAYLTNRVVVAEACDPGELAEVRRCVELVHDYLNIGLAHRARNDEEIAAQLLRETILHPFFQIGVSVTIRLYLQGKQLGASLQARGLSQWVEYLDSPFRETCIGVQRRPPRFFLGLATPGEVLYRRFLTLAEVQQVETVLAQVPVWFAVMQHWGVLPAGRMAEGTTLGTLWNTAFARWIIEERAEIRPLSRGDLVVLQERLRHKQIEEKISEFVVLSAFHFKWTKEEEEAISALAAHASEKLLEVLMVDATTADFKFLSGLLFTA